MCLSGDVLLQKLTVMTSAVYCIVQAAEFESYLCVSGAGSYKVLHSKQIVHIHPSSVLCGKKAKCIVFNELMQTTQKYALCVSAIEAAWLPELAPMVFS